MKEPHGVLVLVVVLVFGFCVGVWCLVFGVWCWVFGLVGSGEGGSAATVLRGRPVQAPPYKGRSVTAAVAFCLCFLNLFTEKSFKLKVIKNFAVFDYF